MRVPILLLFLFLASFSLISQEAGGYHFGLKGGISLANQNWNNADRRILFNNHFNVFVESLDPDEKGSLFAQLGIHSRGSGIRVNFLNGGFANDGYVYRNLSLLLGAKRKLASVQALKPYYFVGVRLEYTLFNNLQDIIERYYNPSTRSSFIYPDPNFITKLNYGISMGGGFEFDGGKFFNPAIEINFSPDLSFQYDQPPIGTVIAPNGMPVDVPQRRIRNFTLEVSLVLRFLREVIYEDR